MQDVSGIDLLEGVDLGDVADVLALAQGLYWLLRALPGAVRYLRTLLERSSSPDLFWTAVELVRNQLGPREADRLIERLAVLHPLLVPVGAQYAQSLRQDGSLPYGDFLADLIPSIGERLDLLGCFRKAANWRDARLLPLNETTRSFQRSELLRAMIKGDSLQRGQIILKRGYGGRSWGVLFGTWPPPLRYTNAEILFGKGTTYRVWVPPELRRGKDGEREARWHTAGLEFPGFWEVLLGLASDVHNYSRKRPRELEKSKSLFLDLIERGMNKKGDERKNRV